MCWVKKNTKKILISFFVFSFVFQGAFASLGVVRAQTGGPPTTPVQGQSSAAVQTAAGTNAQAGTLSLADSSAVDCNVITCKLRDALLWLLKLIRDILYILIASPAASAFTWVIDPANISGPTGILNLPTIYTLWQFIRDFFNLFFIFILLFSAFATIFQVDSFNIRNIFKNVLLVALLINFSFPITRFLIDAANVPMYYFINDVMGSGTGQGGVIAMRNILGYSGIGAGTQAVTLPQVFLAVIFTFLFGISLAVLAVMLIIRLIALTILLIFSPIGFASSLLPGLNKYGQEWWSKFWNYALFGPAAALMLVVSLKFMEAVSTGGVWQSMTGVAINNTVNIEQATTVTQVIFFSIPIILIWSTIGLANKFAIAGAATVVGAGYGAAHWGRKQATKAAMGVTGITYLKNRASNAYESYNKQREAARSDAKARDWATKFGTRRGEQQDQFVASYGFTKAQRSDAQDRADAASEKKVAEEREKMKKRELQVSELQSVANNTQEDKHTRAAAAQLLAEKGTLDMARPVGRAMVEAVRREFGETSTVFKQMNNKIRQYDPVAAFNNMTQKADGTALTEDERLQRRTDYVNSNEFDAKKVGASSFGDVEFTRGLIENGLLSMKEVEEIAKKSDSHKNNIKRSLQQMATTTGQYTDPSTGAQASVIWNRGDNRHKAIQEAHFNMNGNLSPAVAGDADWTKEVFGKLSKDFGTNVTGAGIVDAGYARTVAASVNPSNYKGWITSIKDKEAARAINREIINMQSAGMSPQDAANLEALQRTIERDVILPGLK